MDTIGERWALLVVRELLLGPKRFADLSTGLAHASQSVISQRLKELDSAGLIRRVKLGPPVSAHVYELTDAGRGLEPALVALARWGAILPAAPNATLSPDAFALGLKALYSPPTDDAFRASGEVRLSDDVFAFDTGPTGLDVRRGPGAAPDFEVTGTITEIWNVVTGSSGLAEALQKRVVSVTGDATMAQEFFERFPNVAGPGRRADAAATDLAMPN